MAYFVYNKFIWGEFMLHTKTRWNFLNESMIEDKGETAFERSPITLELLHQRGLIHKEDIESFLSPDLIDLHDTSDLHMIDIAAHRVHHAIEKGEKILVFGDYDADGVSSTTLMMETLQELGAICDFYIPNRFTEGYGPNESAFRDAVNNGFSLVITVDTGIAANHEIDIANDIGLDVIITDHHEIQEHVPDAYAIIHPKCSPNYPFKELAGVGVAFKFAAHLLGYFPKQFLDIVAIGTIADMVPLLEENRVLAHFGLQSLSKTKRPGLKALMQLCQINNPVTEENVGFMIAPRLNAVGRLQDATLAVDLLMTKNLDEATDYAEMIDNLNKERQQIVRTMTAEAEEMVTITPETGIIVVAKEGWNEGVLGIVASRLVKKYDRPAIVLAIKPDTHTAKGSARSIPAFDLFQACLSTENVFTHFGGHAQAAGMSLPIENVELLKEQLDSIILEKLKPEDFTQVIDVNYTLNLSDIDEHLIQDIQNLAPFGMGNPKPIFHIEEVPKSLKRIGSQKNHLKMEFNQDSYSLSGIGFGMGDLFPFISERAPVSVIGELGINEWNGNRKFQIVMKDLGVNDWQLFDHRGKKELDLHTITSDVSELLALGRNGANARCSDDIPFLTYDQEVDALTPVSTLLILDMPESLEQLEKIVAKTKPDNIYACYFVEQGVYMQTFPSRDDFIWFYALVQKRQALDLRKELRQIMKQKNWTKERIIFMSQVFQELGFVKLDNGVVHFVSNPEKKDLQDSRIYQHRIERERVEKTLYYSTFDTLKDWLEQSMEKGDLPKEEMVSNGL